MQYLAIDVGGTFIKFGLLTREGEVTKAWKAPTPDNLADFFRTVGTEIKKCEPNIKGIAYSIPGKVNPKSKFVRDGGAIYYIKQLPLDEWMSTQTKLPFAVINDAKAAALAEHWIGNLKGITNGAAVVFGTGVGGGLILNNELYEGTNYQAGEVGMLFSDSTHTDTQTEVYSGSCSGVNFIRDASEILGVDKDDYKTVFKAIDNNESKEVTKLFNTYCRNAATLIASMGIVLDLEKVVLGGGISSQEKLITEVKRQYKSLCDKEIFGMLLQPAEIAGCCYENSANQIGALRHFLLETETAKNS
ncbi:MAG: ROK family protein [Micrococcaceae bacterium]